jgi:prepilin-type N-terminal cleavage/methylation domain-containing protein
MRRRGVTLIEILVALSLFVLVGSGAMYVLSVQNRNWKLATDKSEMNMMAKSILDELARNFRMAGGGLPDFAGGMAVYGAGEEKVTLVMNESGGDDTILGSYWNRPAKRLRIAVRDASRFGHLGYARIDLQVPAPGQHAASGVTTRSFNLGVVDRTDAQGGCGDSLILDTSPLQDPPNNWTNAGDITAFVNGIVRNIDSLTYRKSKDTLYVKRNLQTETIFATGIDSLRFWYHHPAMGWRDSLSPVTPSNTVNKVRIRVVLRSNAIDQKLLAQDPSTRGYQFWRMETDLAMRNINLTNR